jgi:hypothetical protein
MILDAGTSDSFAGEPATNLVPDAAGIYANSRFNIGNTWYTYNTNNYSGGTFTSIGTIGSVSSNQVTVSSWAKSVFSLDALRPQTTGGGVTANQDYFIFFVNGNDHNSGAPFEIYTFNASQDGSQGYINPTTGYPAVYDGIFDNGRRPNSNVGSAGSGIVTLTGTPTDMWWGYPHLPNTSIVKEVVQGGGRIKGTPCMRFNCPRGWWRSMAGDGMAYGVYPPVTAGDTIRLSFWHRPSPFGFGGQGCAGLNPSWSTYFGAGAAGSSSFLLSSTVGEWKYETYTWTASVTYNFYIYIWPPSASMAYSLDIADLMVTVNEGGAVPWVGGTRSNSNSGASLTGGWADLSGNDNSANFSDDMGPDNLYHFRDDSVMRIMADSTVNTTGAPSGDPVFIDFDGTDDYVDTGLYLSSTCSISCWYKREETDITDGNDGRIMNVNCWNNTGSNNFFYMIITDPYYTPSPSGSVEVWAYGYTAGSRDDWYPAGTTILSKLNVWRNLCLTFDGSSGYVYMDGNFIDSDTLPFTGWKAGDPGYSASGNGQSTLLFGGRRGYGSTGAPSSFLDGQIANCMVFNHTLTAAQVKQNFNTQRSKFGV